MFKILRRLSESWFSVIVIVILLIIQAFCELALPDYTSKIVNVGIQSGGIEHASPNVVSASTMESILFLSEDDEKILSKYNYISMDDYTVKELEELEKKYPKIREESVYELKKISKEERAELDDLMAKNIVVIGILTDNEKIGKIKENLIQYAPEELKEYINEKDLFEILKYANDEQKLIALSAINEKVNQMQNTIIDQAAVQQVKKEYQKIGLNTEKMQIKYILWSGLQMLGLCAIIMVSAVLIMALSSKVAAKLAKGLREGVFKKVLSFSNKEFSEYSTASLITRSTNDIQQIQTFVGIMFRIVVYAPIMGIGGFFRVLSKSDHSMAWIIGLAIFIIVIVVGTLFMITMPKFNKLQTFVDKLNLVSRERLTGLPVIRAFNTEKKEEARFDLANIDLTKTNLFVNRSMSFMFPSMILIMNGISLLIMWFGAKGVDAGNMQIGNILAFIQYTIQIVTSFLVISMISIILPRASVSAKRICEVLETDEVIKEVEKTEKLVKSKKGFVEFKNVSFKYVDGEDYVVQDISFTAKPGETTAIIGSTGSGKSTLINLIPRFYDVTKGEVLVDGVNIKNISSKDLRKIVGFVPQKGILFSGTIESNIKFGNPNMSDSQMIKAAKIAQATEFIESKELKYNEPIAQGGINVSGGQKQRLSIARAIAVDPEVLVFDDSFSALDFKTDSLLRAELAKITKDKTVIIVAQRINTIMNANQIIVLDEGKIVGKGTHKELFENNEVYRQIALSQLSEDELNGKGEF